MGRVFLVDPDTEERSSLAATLRAAGYEVTEWSRSRTALEALGRRAPDALVVASRLADGSGLDLVARVRSRHARPFPIVLVSDDPSVAHEGALVGATESLLRPVDPVAVLIALDEAADPTPVQDLPRGPDGLVFARYRLRRVLGQGSYGAVYEAWDVRRGVLVALKVLSPAVEEPDDLERFVREARVLTKVEHPNVVRMIDAGVLGGRAFCAMRLVDGPSLDMRLKHVGPLREREAVTLLRGLLSALRALAREQLVHRDVTPRNVILEGARVGRPVLIDFGLAKRAHDVALTAPDVILGTPGFIAPEVVIGAQADARADLFAAGVLTLQALTGRHPFDGVRGMALLHLMADTPVAVPDELSPDTRALLARLTALDPAERPATPDEALAELDRVVVAAEPVATAPTPELGPPFDSEPTRRYPLPGSSRGRPPATP